jgi:hypothetical protein
MMLHAASLSIDFRGEYARDILRKIKRMGQSDNGMQDEIGGDDQSFVLNLDTIGDPFPIIDGVLTPCLPDYVNDRCYDRI